ncbi:hypothetical protein AMS68_001112 [Peltaster fructicola]|uniref:Fe2OG dioxygenase domain-containing protein n=1 Tax=Peltaster fructicola TaxID=286661 RepID=A0A6H0XLT8_9PEZI|nr:hypothetical protein AMS68_001112 [Peltaster fructicola]
MSSRWRTIIEVAVIAIGIYIVLGAPGTSLDIFRQSQTSVKPSRARARVESLVHPDRDLQCPPHDYQVHLFSAEPLIIYIENFLSEEETEHFIRISQEKWQVSTVFNAGVEVKDENVRKSEKALIDRDTTVQCLEQRALDFQGWPEDTFIERLWTQRYNVSGHYAHHYDWATASKESRRVSTFMVYLSADCEGGGTEFPRLQPKKDDRWCDFLECGSDKGVTFKAKKGAAVFWMNFDADGRGYKDTIHAGMPVIRGTKIGLNIWSRYQAGYEP